MTQKPLVSVVLVIRDVERYLPEAIESILGQTFRDFEFIIVDFGSSDKSKDIAERYAAADDRVKVSSISPCTYIEAKVAACALPVGRYIAIQDADDVSLPDRLAAEVAFLEAHPGVGLLGGAVQWMDAGGNPISSPGDYPTTDTDIQRELALRNVFWHPTVMMLREAYAGVGGYRRIFNQSDDYDLWLRITERYRCANLGQKVLNYRIHAQQLSFRKRKDQILCALAAQAAASLRRAGMPDPLDQAREITPDVLSQIGVSEVVQKRELASGYEGYIHHMFDAGGYGAVPAAIGEMFEICKGGDLQPRFVSDMYVLSARAYWKQGRVLRSVLAFAQAVQVRPRVLGRPFRLVLQRQR